MTEYYLKKLFLTILISSLSFMYSCGSAITLKISGSETYGQDLKQDSVAIYHSLINQAELFITKLDHHSAVDNYLEAFNYLEKPFAKDIYNAILCAIYSENLSIAAKWSEYLIKLGVELDFFDQDPFDRIKAEPEIWKTFIDNYPLNRQFFKENINHELSKKIDKLHQIDQEYYKNRALHGIELPGSQDSVMHEVVSIIKEYGYPNNWITGLYMSSPKNSSILGNIWVVVLHIYQTSLLLANEISPILKNEVLNGNLLPSTFSQWEEHKHSRPSYGKNIVYATPSGYFTRKLDAEELEKFNNNRAQILQNSYEDDLAKSIYILKYPENVFRLNLFIIGFPIDLSDNSGFKKINLDDH